MSSEKSAIPLNDGNVKIISIVAYNSKYLPIAKLINNTDWSFYGRSTDIDDLLMLSLDVNTALSEVGYFEDNFNPMYVIGLLSGLLSTLKWDGISKHIVKGYSEYKRIVTSAEKRTAKVQNTSISIRSHHGTYKANGE